MTTQGLTYEQHAIGARYETARRTVHDADLCTFVNLCGFTEPLFYKHEVTNQRGELVIEAIVRRMIKRDTKA